MPILRVKAIRAYMAGLARSLGHSRGTGRCYSNREMETQKLSFEDFKNIVVERLGCEPEQVTMDASFQEDLNADSLDLVELIYAFEENTGLEIPDEDAEKITTVGQAWEYIQEKAAS
jgi:acyl carrier protein